MKVQVQDEFGVTEQKTTTPLRAGQTEAEVELNKNMSGGKHIAKIQLKSKKGVYDWYALPFDKHQTAKIDTIQSNKTEIPVGENISGTVSLQTDGSFTGSVTARLYDNYERLIDKKVSDITFNNETSFDISLSLDSVLTHLGKLDITVQSNGKQIDRKAKDFSSYNLVNETTMIL